MDRYWGVLFGGVSVAFALGVGLDEWQNGRLLFAAIFAALLVPGVWVYGLCLRQFLRDDTWGMP